MSGSAGVSRQRSVVSKSQGATHPSSSKVKPRADDMPFQPCAATASLLLFAQGSTVVCLHHDTLAIERRFEKHSKDILLIVADSVSETGAGRLVVSYDVGQTAIVWDLLSGEQLSRFVSYESLRVAHWMRNGNIAFGKSYMSLQCHVSHIRQATQRERSFCSSPQLVTISRRAQFSTPLQQ